MDLSWVFLVALAALLVVPLTATPVMAETAVHIRAPLACASSICREAHRLSLAEVISALSHALDLSGGYPRGHAVRACWIGMHIGRALRLGTAVNVPLSLGWWQPAAGWCWIRPPDGGTNASLKLYWPAWRLSQRAARKRCCCKP